ncbi:MAG: histidine--tRNA ligase [archaeon]
MKLENVKGTRDFPPEEKIVRNSIIDILKNIFERYGFNPLETPVLESWELLTAKGGVGESSDTFNEMYRLQDQGGRKLGLRYELTLSLARFVAMNPTMKMPFKRYEIGSVYRDGPIKLGRYREFTQCDVDTIGVSGMAADAECILLARSAFQELKMPVTIELNNRKLLFAIMQFADIPESKQLPAIMSIDKLKKIGKDGVQDELEKLGIEESAIAKILSAFSVSGTNEEKVSMLKGIITNEQGKAGLQEIREVLALVNGDDIVFNPALARGLGYYTGTVFEGFLDDSEIKGSVCGGGRYDGMIGMLGNKPYPAVGIAFGVEPIIEAVKLQAKQLQKSVVKAYVIPIKNFLEALQIAQELRAAGITTDIDLQGRGISKNLDYANAMGIPFAVIAGPEELAQGKVKVKNMTSGEEATVSRTAITETLR